MLIAAHVGIHSYPWSVLLDTQPRLIARRSGTQRDRRPIEEEFPFGVVPDGDKFQRLRADSQGRRRQRRFRGLGHLG